MLGGSGTDPKMLAMAGIDDADLLVAVTNSDEVNLVSALLARLAGVDKTIEIGRANVRTSVTCLPRLLSSAHNQN